MKFYRKQPLEAEQFDGSQKLVFGYSVIPSILIDAIAGKPAYYSMLVDDVCQDSDDDTGVVLEVGDWIVKEADEIEVVADDVFKQTYAELPVIPEEVYCLIKQTKEWDYNLGMVFYDAYSGHAWNTCTSEWIMEHADMFAHAFLDGYQVEDHA